MGKIILINDQRAVLCILDILFDYGMEGNKNQSAIRFLRNVSYKRQFI